MTEIQFSPYDDRTRFYPIVPEPEMLRSVGATNPCLPAHAVPRLDVAHPYNYFQQSDPSSQHHGELNPLRFTHPSFTFLPVGNEPSDGTLADSRNICQAPQLCNAYHQWGPFSPSPNLLPNSYGVSTPQFHHPSLDQNIYSDSGPQFPWSARNNQVMTGDDLQQVHCSDYHPNAVPSDSGPSPHFDFTSQPSSGMSEASYPQACLWTESGVICNVMVHATRSQMNRHLHTYHGFCGSDTRPTKCRWAGCGETMQQGSIARHMVTCHLQAKVTCPTCSKKLSRQDVISKHQRVCPAAGWR